MMQMLRSLYRDWARAPISGTSALVTALVSIQVTYAGNPERGDHLFIVAMLMLIGRGRNDASQG